MGKKITTNDDFVMTIDDDQEVAIEEEAMEMSEQEEEKPVDKKTAKKLRKQANREQKQGLSKANAEKQKKKMEEESAFDADFSFSMDGGMGARGQKDWDFTAARGMLKGKQVSMLPLIYQGQLDRYSTFHFF